MKKELIRGFTIGLFIVLSVHHTSAIMVTVDWTADVTPNSNEPTPGSGVLSGSLGTFDVTEVGEVFDIPIDGSLSIIASGFTSGFPNGSYQLTRGSSHPFKIEFTDIGISASDFSLNIVDNNGGILSPYPNPCIVNGIQADCFVGLFDVSGSGADVALASLGLDGSINDESHGLVNYSFTVVPEPSSIAMIGLVSGCAVFIRRRFVV